MASDSTGLQWVPVRLLLLLALRNLLRHKRRTFLTAAALVMGIALMVLGRAWTRAMEGAVVVPARRGTLGDVQVYRKDAAADEGGHISFILPQNNYRLIEDPAALVTNVLQEEPRLQAGLARLMVGALVSNGESSMEAVLIGIDPRVRETVYPAVGLREGRHFAPGEHGVLLNRGVAKRLSASVGTRLVALGNTSDGRLSAVKLVVTGLWTIPGLEAYEWGACYADIAAVQELLDAGSGAGVVVFRQRDAADDASAIAADLNARFARDGTNRVAYSWEQMGGPFIGGMLLTRFIARIMDLVMAVIVAAGVTNTALMSVFERTREIGTLRAVGARRGRILGLFLLEGLMLGLAGAVGGAVLGAGLVLFFERAGIPAFSEAQRYSYGGDYLFPSLVVADVVVVPATMLLVCLLAATGPAILAARRRPAEALRFV
jgi:putative ABC transport system permease protein